MFPEKCGRILNDSYKLDKHPGRDREVTHMIALAVAGISMTYERLYASDATGDKKREEYKESYDEFNDSLALNFLEFHKLYRENVWFYGEWQGKPNEWENEVNYRYQRLEDFVKNPDKLFTVKDFLQHLRNALAHSNIAFLPKRVSSGRYEIGQIVFLQRKFEFTRVDEALRQLCADALEGQNGKEVKALKKAIKEASVSKEGYAYLATTPAGFYDFLNNWFEFVSSLKIDEAYEKQRILGDANNQDSLLPLQQ